MGSNIALNFKSVESTAGGSSTIRWFVPEENKREESCKILAASSVRPNTEISSVLGRKIPEVEKKPCWVCEEKNKNIFFASESDRGNLDNLSLLFFESSFDAINKKLVWPKTFTFNYLEKNSRCRVKKTPARCCKNCRFSFLFLTQPSLTGYHTWQVLNLGPINAIDWWLLVQVESCKFDSYYLWSILVLVCPLFTLQLVILYTVLLS